MIRSIPKIALGLLLITGTGVTFISCKDQKKVDTVEPAPPVTAPAEQTPAPVVISEDTSLNKGVTDATKDFPTVKASVNDGVITLTGEVEKPQLITLMQSLQSLRPKKIDNQ